jgi:hypothetical protein
MKRALWAAVISNLQFDTLRKISLQVSWLIAVLVVFTPALAVAGQSTADAPPGRPRPLQSQKLDLALAAVEGTFRARPDLVPLQMFSADCNSERISQTPTFSLVSRSEVGGSVTRALGSESQASSSDRTKGANTAEGAVEADSKASSLAITTTKHPHPDSNLDIYYRNRLEFGLDVGWHPVNIPFVYDFAVGDAYNMTPLKYTLVPIIASLRWHVTNVGWKWIFRGNADFTFSGAVTPIPRGPETHYYAFMFGIRRNFVYRNWKAVPFFEQRGGAGMIDAKEPLGVLWAQGQNLTFNYTMGAGVRYNFNSKYSFSAGMNYMHISNAYLSEPTFKNYGINVYGPMFGMNVRLGKARRHESE